MTTTRIQDVPKIDRLREKMARYGPEKLSEAELLAILLGTGTRSSSVIDISKKILRKFPEDDLAKAQVKDLIGTFGLGEAKACEIVACFELGKRLLKDKRVDPYLSPQDVWMALHDIRESRKEHFVAFYLDTNHQEIKREIVSVGTLNSNLVHPREVFEPAVRHVAAQIIIAHNHPSGNSQPSDEDIDVTRRLSDAGRILGIEILDHVVVTKRDFFSLKENGIF